MERLDFQKHVLCFRALFRKTVLFCIVLFRHESLFWVLFRKAVLFCRILFYKYEFILRLFLERKFVVDVFVLGSCFFSFILGRAFLSNGTCFGLLTYLMSNCARCFMASLAWFDVYCNWVYWYTLLMQYSQPSHEFRECIYFIS